MKYKDYTAPDAAAQGFVRQLDSVGHDLEDADGRDALAGSEYVEFFGELFLWITTKCVEVCLCYMIFKDHTHLFLLFVFSRSNND